MSVSGETLTTATLDFAARLATLSDDDLIQDWTSRSAPGRFWSGYDDSAREVAYRVSLQLHELAAIVESQQASSSEAQRILAQHQRAYRDLTGALVAVRDADFAREPVADEWSLRTILHHVTLVERGFHALIHWAIRRRQGGDRADISMPDTFRDEVSEPVTEQESITTALQQFDALHRRVQDDFVGLDATDLEALNVWWEGYEIPVRFRLNRFRTHLSEHTVQIDKTLVWLGYVPTEPQRLARLIHGALGAVEGALLGDARIALDRQHTLAAEIANLTDSLPA